MTQPTLNIDELLTKMGEAYRALMPQRTPEEDEAYWQEYNARFYAKVHADLDERNVVICCLCHTERPRTSPDEPYYYPADECPKEVRVWHYHRFWRDPEADRESKRQHALAVARRRGRIPAHSD
ncbi:hypothetical protein OIU91_16570 [Streptomyces sp. NBC_01456]|uniref:hypothetical protein n=1 Tax=Streptomyces sp. NBC_01456 TaxID=2975868 RepID=UPI002E301356|nr:hypothetical protein [Streptomyces sp. NBC_01456]